VGGPGRDQAWLFEQPGPRGSAGAGATIARAVKGDISFMTPVPTSDPHLWRVAGLVPDGVTAVRLSKTVVAPVADNAFSRTVAQENLWESKDWIFIRGKATHR
jgi:hypothetical protein